MWFSWISTRTIGFCRGRNVFMQFSSHQELTTMDQPGQMRRLPAEQVRIHSLFLCRIFTLVVSLWVRHSSSLEGGLIWPLPLLDFLLLFLSLLFPLSSSLAGEVGGLSLLCYSPGTAAQSNSFNYHSQPALSYHRGCAAPSVCLPLMALSRRSSPSKSQLVSFSSVITISFSPCFFYGLSSFS